MLFPGRPGLIAQIDKKIWFLFAELHITNTCFSRFDEWIKNCLQRIRMYLGNNTACDRDLSLWACCVGRHQFLFSLSQEIGNVRKISVGYTFSLRIETSRTCVRNISHWYGQQLLFLLHEKKLRDRLTTPIYIYIRLPCGMLWLYSWRNFHSYASPSFLYLE